MKVLFLTNVPSPYRVCFFDELGKLCELTVLFQKQSSSERDSNWIKESEGNYKSIFLKGISTGVDNAFCPEVVKYLSSSFDVIVICGNASPTEIMAIEWCKIRGLSYCLEADGAFLSQEKSWLKRIVKTHLIKGAERFFSTCDENDKYYLFYGADQQKIVRYRFSSLTRSDILENSVSSLEKQCLKKELKMTYENVILAVGQFVFRKGFDVLIESAKYLPTDVGIYIVGGNPTEEYLDYVRRNKLTNVFFEGFKSKSELRKYYMAADIFVLPTREDIWGLVINEAMGYGLPIITTDRCNAGKELVLNGKNGYVVSVGSAIEIKEAILDVLKNREKMSSASLNAIRQYTIENMVIDHVNTFNEMRRCD